MSQLEKNQIDIFFLYVWISTRAEKKSQLQEKISVK